MEVNADHIFRFSGFLQRIFGQSRCRWISRGRIENLLWKDPTGDKLQAMKPPAGLFLAVLTLGIVALTPIVPPQMSLEDSHTSDCCATMNTGRCHSCPMPIGETSSTLGGSCCATQSACCTLYFARPAVFSTSMLLLGTVRVSDERVTTRAERPPVPPPRALFA